MTDDKTQNDAQTNASAGTAPFALTQDELAVLRRNLYAAFNKAADDVAAVEAFAEEERRLTALDAAQAFLAGRPAAPEDLVFLAADIKAFLAFGYVPGPEVGAAFDAAFGPEDAPGRRAELTPTLVLNLSKNRG